MAWFLAILAIKGPLSEIPEDYTVREMITDSSPLILKMAKDDPETGMEFLELMRDFGYTQSEWLFASGSDKLESFEDT